MNPHLKFVSANAFEVQSACRSMPHLDLHGVAARLQRNRLTREGGHGLPVHFHARHGPLVRMAQAELNRVRQTSLWRIKPHDGLIARRFNGQGNRSEVGGGVTDFDALAGRQPVPRDTVANPEIVPFLAAGGK